MDRIYRENYIKKVLKFIDKPIIKVFVGMRRVGKSTIMEMIKTDVLKDVPDDNKIYINFEAFEFTTVKDSDRLIELLKLKLENSIGKLYFFFDEIQLVKNWEKAINALRLEERSDIYITGSNSTLLSGDLSTLLAGRYVSFEIQPFTFEEFSRCFEKSNISKEDLFLKYIKVGSMPFLKYFDLEEAPGHKYLIDVYNTVLVKDVLEYNKIRDVDLFNRILIFAIENIGHSFSANSIRKYLKTENREVSVDTVLNYLQYCTEAFILRKVRRYDVAGKALLKTDEKYYLTDHGFREAKGFSNMKDIERVLENIIYIELISRGYEVRIGRVGDREIDFIALKGDRCAYFQVSYMMETAETREREFGVYETVKDNFPKYVLSMDKFDFSQNGIIHRNILDFLMDSSEFI